MTANQKRDRAGKFDFGTHSEPDISPLRSQPSESTRQALAGRQELLARAAEIRAALAVESASALASHTRDLFPDAAYIGLIADDVDGRGARVTGIWGAGGKLLAARAGGDKSRTEAFESWSRAGEAGESIEALTADLGGHAADLSGAMELTSSPRADGFGVYSGACSFSLHLDRMLDTEEHREPAA
ncbi:hypothetical protein [Arthrobacter caoxuetaonis]|uniref:Uncharacterized protein n=1 Tax=Arthrobacter caoxuetaonis TaxID=2886935 RepID=A0A9X1MHJ1_9MICC|nr:hypothetical protein [Arthrobacter caoxuetaonis]MCC3299731.1 hypothetical protein [Arthrobacter caoxuetaonis]USQ59367.1 hypothetical protein NF551_17620 [Arthrobacter caoxuetaonis]